MNSPIPIPPVVEGALVQWAEALLIERGARVVWPEDETENGEWISPMALLRSLDPMPSEATFRSRLRSLACPRFAKKVSAATGRLLKLQPTPALREFLQRPPQKGVEL